RRLKELHASVDSHDRFSCSAGYGTHRFRLLGKREGRRASPQREIKSGLWIEHSRNPEKFPLHEQPSSRSLEMLLRRIIAGEYPRHARSTVIQNFRKGPNILLRSIGRKSATLHNHGE